MELPLREVSSDSVKTDTEASEALGKTLGVGLRMCLHLFEDMLLDL